jgi:hypothetical protein
MSKVVDLAEYRKEREKSQVSRILDIPGPCSQQSASRRMASAEEEFQKYKWTDWTKEPIWSNKEEWDD